jgi:flagellar hook-basal body complex protein FliE
MQLPSYVASQLYSNARSATRPVEIEKNISLVDFASQFHETMHAGEETVKAGMVGGADAQAVVEALAVTELAVQTAVSVRDKVVEAYQEILRMPV